MEEPPFIACPERVEGGATSAFEDDGFNPWILSHSPKALGVDTPIAGVTTTQAVGGKSGKENTCSPRSRPSTVPPTKNNGRSEPTSAAIRNLSAWGRVF